MNEQEKTALAPENPEEELNEQELLPEEIPSGEDAPSEEETAASEEAAEETEPAEEIAEEPESPEEAPETEEIQAVDADSDEASDEKDPEQEKKEKRKTVVITVMMILAIILCFSVVSQVLSQGYVSIGGFSLFRVVTGSMEPEIPVGSLLISSETELSEIQVGDIVNYRSRENGMLGMVITHRVIGVHVVNGTTYLETKGDANQYADVMYVDEDVLIGKVIFYTKEGNLIASLFTFLTSSVGFLACIVLPCLVIGVTTIQDCIKSLRTELDDMNRQLKQVEQKNSRELELTPEEYEELYSRLRSEVLEELRKSVEAQTE